MLSLAQLPWWHWTVSLTVYILFSFFVVLPFPSSSSLVFVSTFESHLEYCIQEDVLKRCFALFFPLVTTFLVCVKYGQKDSEEWAEAGSGLKEDTPTKQHRETAVVPPSTTTAYLAECWLLPSPGWHDVLQ